MAEPLLDVVHSVLFVDAVPLHRSRFSVSPVSATITTLRGSMAESDTKSVFDMEPDPALEARLDAKAEAEIDAGRGVPHERVREWLSKLGKGEKLPPPVA